MSRGPRGPRRRAEKPKVVEIVDNYDEDEEIDLRDTPEYRRRQLLVRIGTSILLFAFVSTSGITCAAGMMSTGQDAPAQTSSSGTPAPLDPVSADIARYREDLKKEPQNLESKSSLAAYLVQRGVLSGESKGKADRDEAQKLLSEVLAQQPNNFQVLQIRAKLEQMQKETTKAKEDFLKVVELTKAPVDPKAPDKEAQEANQMATRVEALLGLTELMVAEKNLPGAMGYVEEALKLSPGSGNGYLMRAQIQVAQNQPEAARRDFGLALDVARNMPMGSLEQRVLLVAAQSALEKLTPKSTATPTPSSATPTPKATP